MSKSPFKLLGLTQDHKDFLYRYAQNELGSSSRTKAILALIDKAMCAEAPKIKMIFLTKIYKMN